MLRQFDPDHLLVKAGGKTQESAGPKGSAGFILLTWDGKG